LGSGRIHHHGLGDGVAHGLVPADGNLLTSMNCFFPSGRHRTGFANTRSVGVEVDMVNS
jgi:hypothetical protein